LRSDCVLAGQIYPVDILISGEDKGFLCASRNNRCRNGRWKSEMLFLFAGFDVDQIQFILVIPQKKQVAARNNHWMSSEKVGFLRAFV